MSSTTNIVTNRDHCYLLRCTSCGQATVMNRQPLKCHKEGRTHARRAKGHRVIVFNMTVLKIVATYYFEKPSHQYQIDPPF